MFTALRQHWKDFKAGTPGKRFQEIHRKRKERQGAGSTARKWVFTGLGILLTLVGLVLLVAPGPGTLLLAPGLALLAGESMGVARALDWMELRLRALLAWAKKRWQHATSLGKVAITSCIGLLASALLLSAYLMFIK